MVSSAVVLQTRTGPLPEDIGEVLAERMYWSWVLRCPEGDCQKGEADPPCGATEGRNVGPLACGEEFTELEQRLRGPQGHFEKLYAVLQNVTLTFQEVNGFSTGK